MANTFMLLILIVAFFFPVLVPDSRQVVAGGFGQRGTGRAGQS